MEILIAEDDLVSRRLLETTLSKWGYQVVSCANGQEAWEVVQSGNAPKIMILDWMMPGYDGPQLCRMVRKLETPDYVYLILLTARVQKEDVVAGMDAGADDYITKPFNKQELQVRLRAGRRIIELQEQLLTAQEQLRQEAIHDPLTGLLNRGAIEETLETELARVKRGAASLSVVMLDLDHFKVVNDTYGHLAGDSILRQTALRMNESIRAYDSVGRYGGEEFLLIFPNIDLPEAKELAERIRLSICEEMMDTPEGMIPVSASLGLVTITGDNKINQEELVSLADSAMYQAKANGRNCTAVSEGRE